MNITRRATIAGALALPLASHAHAAAPLAGPMPASVHRYRVGDFDITAILDGVRVTEKPEGIYGINKQPADVAALLEENFLPTDKFLNSFTPVIVNTGKEVVLFDSGLGPSARGNGLGRLRELLATAGYTPEQIDVVVITHFHGDHIGGLMEDGKPLAPNARYVIGEKEYAFWTAPERLSGPTENAAKLVQANVVPLADKTTFVKGEAEAAPGIRAIESFGHTPGHTSWHIESAGKRLVIGGDFCNHFVLSLQRPDWHVRFDADKDMGVATRKKMLDMLAADRIPFTSYHMPFPALGYVAKRADGGYHFVPATYQLSL